VEMSERSDAQPPSSSSPPLAPSGARVEARFFLAPLALSSAAIIELAAASGPSGRPTSKVKRPHGAGRVLTGRCVRQARRQMRAWRRGLNGSAAPRRRMDCRRAFRSPPPWLHGNTKQTRADAQAGL
jgi:hypothetical protein